MASGRPVSSAQGKSRPNSKDFTRCETGKFDQYMKYIPTTWKASQEAAKKAGYTTGYKVISVESRSENDPRAGATT
jgi:hypothetical protein